MKKRVFSTLVALFCAGLFVLFTQAASAQYYGDVDGDGRVTAADARSILRYSVNLETPSETQRVIADLDKSGGISAADARLALRIAVGLEDIDEYILTPAEINAVVTCRVTDDAYFIAGKTKLQISITPDGNCGEAQIEIIGGENEKVFSASPKNLKKDEATIVEWDGKQGADYVSTGLYTVRVTVAGKETVFENVPFAKTSPFTGGTGSQKDPFLVASIEQFDRIPDFPKGWFLQTNDFDYAGGSCAQKFTKDAPFEGVYNGNEKTVSNVSSGNPLFNYIGSSGTVKNLRVESSSFTCSSALVNINNGKITDCSVDANVSLTQEYNGDLTVGLIASENRGVINNCAAAGKAAVSNTYGYKNAIVGGICGKNSGKVLSCVANVSVSAASKYSGEYTKAGGVTGINQTGGFVQNCEGKGVINSCNKYAGIAAINDGQVNNCIYTGDSYVNYVSGGSGILSSERQNPSPATVPGRNADVKVQISDNGWFVAGVNTLDIEVTPKTGVAQATIRMINGADDTVFETTLSGLTNNTSAVYQWDGKKTNGSFANSGVYSVTVTTGDETLTVKSIRFMDKNYFSGGNGTQEAPFEISLPAQVKEIVRFPGAYFRQTSDLDFSADGFHHIFTEDSQFFGVYDGNGKKITNVLSNDPMINHVGKDGVVKSVTLENGNFTCHAALVYKNRGKITDCTVNANVSYTRENDGDLTVGMIASENSGVINNCVTSGKATVSNTYSYKNAIVGGICGKNSGKVLSCTANVSVSAASKYSGEYTKAGGVAGINQSGGFVQNCEGKGVISSCNKYAGVAAVNDGQVINCIYTGESYVNLVHTGSGITNSERQIPSAVTVPGSRASLRAQISDNGWFVAGVNTLDIEVTPKADAAQAVILFINGADDVVFETVLSNLTKDTASVFQWNGKKENGSFAGSGIYSVNVTVGDETLTVKNIKFMDKNYFSGGNGTQEAPFEISLPAQVKEIVRFPGAYFRQTSDLDFSADGFHHIFTEDSQFFGVYDGNGKKITNVLSNDPMINHVGKDGVVKSVTLENGNFTCHAALVYKNRGKITDCTVNANVSYTRENDGDLTVGMIASENSGVINNCVTSGKATVSNTYSYKNAIVGGICGKNSGKVLSCTANVSVSAASKYSGEYTKAGGVAGINQSGGFIQNCEAMGAVSNCDKYAAIAAVNDGQVNNCFYTGYSYVKLVHSGSGITSSERQIPGAVTVPGSNMTVKTQVSDNGWFVAGVNTLDIEVTPKTDLSQAVIRMVNGADDAVFETTLTGLTENTVVVFRWDGKKTDGSFAGSGVYTVTVTAGSETLTVKNIKFMDKNYFSGGNGTEEAPFEISLPAQVKDIVRFPGAYFKQTEDLDFDYEGFHNIFMTDSQFFGVYDGNGKKIINVLSNDPMINCVGKDGVVKSVILENGNFTCHSALVYINNGKITDCTVNANVSMTRENDGDLTVGVIVSENKGVISNCTAAGNAAANNTYSYKNAIVGGICGKNSGKVLSCTANVNVTAASKYSGDYTKAGGICGVNQTGGFVQGCEAKGVINICNKYAGIAAVNDGQVANCVYTGPSAVSLVASGSGIVS